MKGERMGYRDSRASSDTTRIFCFRLHTGHPTGKTFIRRIRHPYGCRRKAWKTAARSRLGMRPPADSSPRRAKVKTETAAQFETVRCCFRL